MHIELGKLCALVLRHAMSETVGKDDGEVEGGGHNSAAKLFFFVGGRRKFCRLGIFAADFRVRGATKIGIVGMSSRELPYRTLKSSRETSYNKPVFKFTYFTDVFSDYGFCIPIKMVLRGVYKNNGLWFHRPTHRFPKRCRNGKPSV